MNKQIEIEEMAKIIAQSVDEETLCDGLAGDSSMACFGCDYSEKEYCKHHFESGTGLYNKGYRKASDVAREIFEEIERHIEDVGFSSFVERSEFKDWIAELKKKYESEGVDDE